MEWALDWSVFQAVIAHFGLSPVIVLLATPLNSQLLVFISPLLDPAAFSVNALSVPGDSFGMAYTFHPTAFMHNVLMKLQGLDLIPIMVALWWLN